MSMRRGAITGIALLAVVTVGATYMGQSVRDGTTTAQNACAVDAASVVPDSGALFGVNLDWGAETLAEFSEQIGGSPATAVVFSNVPFTDEDRSNLRAAAGQVRGENSSLLVTLEPREGLDAVTPEVAADIATLLGEISDTGVPVILRYAHEMNGSWYAWGQQPTAYRASFRLVAESLDDLAPGVAMMWAPNYGGGYPFAGGEFESTITSPDFRLLDTDDDGALSMADDPYAPYYPGDDVVDWAGMSLYHWGNTHPWGENELAEPSKFADQLTGEYVGAGGDDSRLPDFYADYVVEAGKPLAIPETAAFVTADAPADRDLQIKRSWWSQVFSDETAERFPGLAMINWFEWNKYEVEVDDEVDWRVGGDANVREQFVDALPDWVRFAPETDRCA